VWLDRWSSEQRCEQNSLSCCLYKLLLLLLLPLMYVLVLALLL
jgi:hypothetical protein